MNGIWKAVSVLALVVALVVGGFQVLGAPAEFEARTYGTNVYMEQGGAKMVVASGGEVEVQSGATLDLQAGATTDFSSGVDLDGGLLDIDADGDTSIQADTDDQIDVEISAADDFQFTANTFTALSGSTIKANTIAETTATNGVVIDSVTVKDGGILAAGTGLIDTAGITDGLVIDSDGDTTISAPTDDQIDIEISGADDFTFTANTFTAASGSSIVLASGAYPLGYGSSGQQLVYGTASITGTATASHGLTTVTFCVATLGEDPTSGAGDAAHVSVAVSGNVCTLKAWQDDFVTAATEADVAVHWLVIGTP